MASRLNCAAKTDVGLKRTNNEDNLIMVPGEGLYVLADGMGGHASGQVASTMCVSHVAKFICEMARQPDFELPYSKDPKLSPEANLLINAIKYANERIYIQSCKDRSMEGMGTTVTAIFNAPHGLILAHVGDSRIYRIRKGQITQMSRDHSLLNHLIDTGELKPEDARNFPQKNIILRAIGLKETVDVDVKEVPREDGDVYLMCSDGLSDLVDAPVIAQTVTNTPNLTEACNQLIGLALKAGGKDNVTVVCVGVEGKDDVQIQPRPVSGTKNVVTTVPNIPPKPSSHSRLPSTSYANEPAAELIPPRPGHAAMVPPPKGRASISSQHAAVSSGSAPMRMHSVREIVQTPKTPASTSAPRQAVSRSSVSNMPAIPSMGKVKAVQNDQETTSQTRQSSGGIPAASTPSSKDSLPKTGRTTLPPVKSTASPAPSAKQPLPKPSGLSKLPSISKLPTVTASPTQPDKNESAEDISKVPTLPEAKLIFTQPPVIAGAEENPNQKTTILPSLDHFPPPPEFVPEYVDESDELEDDGAKTMLECPVLDTSRIPSSSFPGNKSIPRLPKVPSGNSSKPSNPSISRIKTQPSAVLPSIPPSPSSVMPAVSSSIMPAIPPSPSSVMPAISTAEIQSIKPIATAPQTNRQSPSIPSVPAIKPPVYLNTPTNRVIPDVLNDAPTLENAPDYHTASMMLSQTQKIPPAPNKRNANHEADNGFGNPNNKKW